MNLVTNARDAMPLGGTLTLEVYEADTSAIGVAARPGLQPGRYVWLAVADTGVGMDEANRERVFEPFFTTKAPGRGTGLGMAMVYGLAKKHGGYVHIASRPGVGTRVEVGFPVTPGLVRRGRGAERPPAPPRAATPRPAASVTILLVEDEDAVQRVATRALRSQGYHVLSAADGSEALRILHTPEQIDLLLVDLVLPRLGGRELVERLARDMRHLPVIYTSGYSRDAPEGGTVGPWGIFLGKPWTLDELFGAINRALDPTPQRLAEAEEAEE